MESSQEKTEKPSHKKISDARKDGNVAYSKDLSMIFVLMLMFALIYIFKYKFSEIFANNFLSVFQIITTNELSLIEIKSTVFQLFKGSALFIIMLVISAATIAALVTTIQIGGFLIKEKPIKIDLNRFNLVNNLKQIFGKKSLIKFLINCIKLCLMVIVSFFVIKGNIKDILLVNNLNLDSATYFLFIVVFKFILINLVIFLLWSFIDYFLERSQWYKKLMMSFEELKKEDKETNGNPEVRSKRREMHREILDDDYMFDHKDSMFVMANPTHIAICIVYNPSKWKLPIVLSKSKGFAAQVIFKKAKQYNIPIIKNKIIARQLFDIAGVNQFIPSSLSKDIAWIIAKNLHLLPFIKQEIEAKAM